MNLWLILTQHLSAYQLHPMPAKSIPPTKTPIFFKAFQVTTSLNAIDDEASAAGVPWWLYLLAILIGLVLLALLILLLWRVSFYQQMLLFPVAHHSFSVWLLQTESPTHGEG